MGLLKELLPVLDNLGRALEHGKKEDAKLDVLLEGIQMVYKMFYEAFEKFGVSRVKSAGEMFNPNVHQAIGTTESESVPENHIVDEFQMGYLLHDRIIRPAMVRISKKSVNWYF